VSALGRLGVDPVRLRDELDEAVVVHRSGAMARAPPSNQGRRFVEL
jgi:hypothetical protein